MLVLYQYIMERVAVPRAINPEVYKVECEADERLQCLGG